MALNARIQTLFAGLAAHVHSEPDSAEERRLALDHAKKLVLVHSMTDACLRCTSSVFTIVPSSIDGFARYQPELTHCLASVLTRTEESLYVTRPGEAVFACSNETIDKPAGEKSNEF